MMEWLVFFKKLFIGALAISLVVTGKSCVSVSLIMSADNQGPCGAALTGTGSGIQALVPKLVT